MCPVNHASFLVTTNVTGQDVDADNEADKAKDANTICRLAKDVGGRLGPKIILGSLKRSGKGKISYSYRQHTRTETRYVSFIEGTVYLVVSNILSCAEMGRLTEGLCPSDKVKDKGFKRLMKTGRPNYWIRSPSAVSRDVNNVPSKTRNHIAKLLQVGHFSFKLSQFWVHTGCRSTAAR